MLDRGIYLAPSQFEAGFLSAAHTEQDIARTVACAREFFAIAEVKLKVHMSDTTANPAHLGLDLASLDLPAWKKAIGGVCAVLLAILFFVFRSLEADRSVPLVPVPGAVPRARGAGSAGHAGPGHRGDAGCRSHPGAAVSPLGSAADQASCW